MVGSVHRMLLSRKVMLKILLHNGALELASGSSMDGSTIVTEITDRDSFSDLGFSCQMGDIPKWDGSLAM